MAYFLSYALHILLIEIFFEVLHMLFLLFFEISSGFNFEKNPKRVPVQVRVVPGQSNMKIHFKVDFTDA